MELHVMELMSKYDNHSTSWKASKFCYEPASDLYQVMLKGVIPITLRKQHNVPIDINIPYFYPNEPPVCYVHAPSGMQMKRRHADVDSYKGLLVHPYIISWHERCSLASLVEILISAFTANPPFEEMLGWDSKKQTKSINWKTKTQKLNWELNKMRSENKLHCSTEYKYKFRIIHWCSLFLSVIRGMNLRIVFLAVIRRIRMVRSGIPRRFYKPQISHVFLTVLAIVISLALTRIYRKFIFNHF